MFKVMWLLLINVWLINEKIVCFLIVWVINILQR